VAGRDGGAEAQSYGWSDCPAEPSGVQHHGVDVSTGYRVADPEQLE
jgi:hypothetical protein